MTFLRPRRHRCRRERCLAILRVCRLPVNINRLQQKANLNNREARVLLGELQALGYIRVVDKGLVAYKGRSSNRFYVATLEGRLFLRENSKGYSLNL